MGKIWKVDFCCINIELIELKTRNSKFTVSSRKLKQRITETLMNISVQAFGWVNVLMNVNIKTASHRDVRHRLPQKISNYILDYASEAKEFSSFANIETVHFLPFSALWGKYIWYSTRIFINIIKSEQHFFTYKQEKVFFKFQKF